LFGAVVVFVGASLELESRELVDRLLHQASALVENELPPVQLFLSKHLSADKPNFVEQTHCFVMGGGLPISFVSGQASFATRNKQFSTQDVVFEIKSEKLCVKERRAKTSKNKGPKSIVVIIV
jgi:hypothetical protein